MMLFSVLCSFCICAVGESAVYRQASHTAEVKNMFSENTALIPSTECHPVQISKLNMPF